MKQLSAIITLVLILSFLLCSAASADTITAMATEINPDHLEKVASYARILGYNEERNTLTVELTAPLVFRGDEVDALQPGDGIFLGESELTVRTIKKEWDEVIINEGEYLFAEGSLYLYRTADNNYQPMFYESFLWLSLGETECPVKDSLLFLDYIDENELGDPLSLPMVYTARELVDKMLSEQASEVYFIGLAIDNVYVVFDGEGSLATIQRYFVPWQ